MTDINTIPLLDAYEDSLAQAWDGNTGLMYVNAVPNITIPAGQSFYVTVDPGTANQQVAEINAIDGGAKTLTVSNVTIEKGAGLNYSTTTHAVGKKVIISDSYELYKDIKTVIDLKADTTYVDSEIADVEAQLGDFDFSGSTATTPAPMTFNDSEVGPVTLKTLTENSGADKFVSVSATDTTTGNLDAKLTAGTGITLAKNNPGADENLEASVDTTVIASKSYVDTEVGAIQSQIDGYNISPSEIIAVSGTENIYFEANTLQTTQSTSFVKLKEITINNAGTYKTSFDMKTSTSSTSIHAYGQIYVNGIPIGVEHDRNSNSYATYTDDISVNVGDLLQLYVRISNAANVASILNYKGEFNLRSSITGTVDID